MKNTKTVTQKLSIKVSEIKKGDVMKLGNTMYQAETKSYLQGGVWGFDFDNCNCRYGFTSNGEHLVTVQREVEVVKTRTRLDGIDLVGIKIALEEVCEQKNSPIIDRTNKLLLAKVTQMVKEEGELIREIYAETKKQRTRKTI